MCGIIDCPESSGDRHYSSIAVVSYFVAPPRCLLTRQSILCVCVLLCAGRVIISRRCLHVQVSASSLLFAPLPPKSQVRPPTPVDAMLS